MTKWPTKNELEKINKNLKNHISSKLLPENASKVDFVRYSLCEKFVIYKNSNNITQRELAKTLGINESLMSKILHYHFEEFTIDRLLKYLTAIYPNVNLKISLAS